MEELNSSFSPSPPSSIRRKSIRSFARTKCGVEPCIANLLTHTPSFSFVFVLSHFCRATPIFTSWIALFLPSTKFLLAVNRQLDLSSVASLITAFCFYTKHSQNTHIISISFCFWACLPYYSKLPSDIPFLLPYSPP